MLQQDTLLVLDLKLQDVHSCPTWQTHIHMLNDKEIVMAAMVDNSHTGDVPCSALTLSYAPEHLRADREVVMEAISGEYGYVDYSDGYSPSFIRLQRASERSYGYG